MKKVLIHENAERAEAFLSKIDTVYLARVRKLIACIRALGIEDITKDMLLDALHTTQPLLERYKDLYRSDVEVFQMPDRRNEVESAFLLKFREVEKAIEDFYSPEVSNSFSADLNVLAGIFELDEKLRVYIPEERVEILREGIREFIEDPELLRIYNLHNEVAKKTQELIRAVRERGIDRQNRMLSGNAGLSVLSLFEIEDNPERGLFTMKPRRIQYKVEPVEIEEEE